MSIKTIFLDFGNVCAIFDFTKFFERFTSATGVSRKELRDVLVDSENHGYSPMFEAFECGLIGSAKFFHLLTTQLGIVGKISYPAFADMWTDIFVGENTLLSNLLDRVPREKYLLSNTNMLVYGRYIAQTKIVKRHIPIPSHRILSCDSRIRAMKPNPSIYYDAFIIAGRIPEECIFIDDLAENIFVWESLGGHGIVYDARHDAIDVLEQKLVALGVVLN